MPKITYAILAYHDSPYLRDCIESIKNQSMQGNIYISTSTPSDYIKKIATQFQLEIHVNTAGKSIAGDWNFALQNAQTKYVTLIHQDDIYLPDFGQRSFDASEKFNDTLITFSDYSELVNGKVRSNGLCFL